MRRACARGTRRAVLAALCAAVLVRGAAGQVEVTREFQIKAAFLFNFGQFVDWPTATCPATDAPFVIGVLGTDRIGPSLTALTSGASIHDRPVAIERYESVDEVGACQILFVSASETARLDAVFAALADKHVLTVGETPEFTRTEGIIGLRIVDNRMRMEINTSAAAAAELSISSKLLGLADVVRVGGN